MISYNGQLHAQALATARATQDIRSIYSLVQQHAALVAAYTKWAKEGR
jgi:hypothetical protein